MSGQHKGGEITAYVTAPHNLPHEPIMLLSEQEIALDPHGTSLEWLTSRAPCSHGKGPLRSSGAMFHASSVSKPSIMSMNFKQAGRSFTTSPNPRPQ